MGKRISTRQITSAGLVLIALLWLASVVLYTYLPGVGYLISPTSISPTATYTGQMGVSFQGKYHYLTAVPKCRHNLIPCSTPDEDVFYLETNTTITRLIFYCHVVPAFCVSADQLPFGDGTFIHVKGTLIEPSKWPTALFEPALSFSADLYVFYYSTLPVQSRNGDRELMKLVTLFRTDQNSKVIRIHENERFRTRLDHLPFLQLCQEDVTFGMVEHVHREK